MKVNSLPKLAWCLDHLKHEIVIPEEIRSRAERSLTRMLERSQVVAKPTAEEEEMERSLARPGGCGCA